MTEKAAQLETLFDHVVTLPPRDAPLNVHELPTCGGVYAISDEQDKVILALPAANIRRSAKSRLSPPDTDQRKPRTDYRAIAKRLWWKPSHSDFERALDHLDLARQLWPNDYRKQIGFAPALFASMNLADAHPRWKPVTTAFMQSAIDVGPFARRADCAEWITLLEDLFDLCRYPNILEQSPHGLACAYFDMGQCPAPCDGSVTMRHYRDTLRASARFATGSFDERLIALESMMTEAAQRRDYAKAARYRELLDRARRLIAKENGAGTTPDEFRFLVVQRGERMFHVKHFVFDAGMMVRGETVPVAEISAHADKWIDNLAARLAPGGSDPVERSERIALVMHFLGKGVRAGGVFLRAGDGAATTDNLARIVREKFGAADSDNAPNGVSSIDSK